MPMLTPSAIWKSIRWPNRMGAFGPTGPNGTTAKPIVAAMIAIAGARM